MAKQPTSQSFNKAAKKIVLAAQHIGRTVPKALRLIAEEILTDVKASSPGHGVPVDKGILRSTGVVEPIALLEVDISFGGAAAPYALKQHEGLEFHHKIGEARYLVRGLERWEQGGSAAMKGLKDNVEAAVKIAEKS